MTHTFNPGPAMVEIATVLAGNIALLCSGLNKRHLISTEFLHSIRSMIPPEATAVIDRRAALPTVQIGNSVRCALRRGRCT